MRFTISLKCCGILFGFLVSFCTVVSATEVTDTGTELTLKQALTLSLAHNPQLYQYRFTREALEAEKETSALRPSLALELDLENFAGSGETKGLDTAETTLALSSVIELGDKRKARMSYAGARLDKAVWEQQAVTLDVLGKITQFFIETLATQANIQLAEESQALSQSLYKTVKARSFRGAAPEAEVMRAKAALVRAEVRLTALKKKLERNKVNLAIFWGETNPRFHSLAGELFRFKTSESFEELYARVQNSPALEVLASEARLQDAQVTLARTSGRSDLSWRAGVRRFEETGDSAFVVGLSMPLFSGKRNTGEVKAALANRNAVNYAKQHLLLRLRAQLFDAHSLREQSLAEVNSIQTIAIPALEKALRLTRKAYENGRYRYLDLIAAQEDLLERKQALIDAATTVHVSQALIERLSSEPLQP